MSDPKKLTASLRAVLERIERHSGELLELAVTASGGREYGKLQRLLSAGYVVRVDQPTVKASKWPAEALAVTGLGKMRWRYRKGIDQDRIRRVYRRYRSR
jgi:hypothetical protein